MTPTTKPQGRTIVGTVAAAFFAVACIFVYCRIFSLELPDYFFPDETAAYDIFRARGLIAGVGYYWMNFIGRPSAMTWLGVPIVLTQRVLHLDPWHSVVATRAFNYLAALASLSILIRTVLRLRSFLSVAIAALILAAILAGIGTTGVKYYWLVDQSIYGFSFIAYCLVLALFWRVARGPIDKNAWWLPVFFVLYIGAHEVNLVAGGMMLALYLLILLPRFFNRSLDKASRTMAFTLLAAYVVMAYLEVFSPSLGFRYQFFSVDKTWWEAAQIGFPAAFLPLFELGLGWHGAVVPVFLTGLVAGAWSGVLPPSDRRRIELLVAPLACAVVVSILMGILSSRYLALMDPFYNFSDAKIFPFIERLGLISLPVRQNIYSYQLWFSGLFFSGAAIGISARRYRIARTSWAVAVLGIVGLGWLTTVSVTSKTFDDAWHFDLSGRLQSMALWLKPLSAPPGFDGTRYLDEPPPAMYAEWGWDKTPIGHPKGTTYPLDLALEGMFRGGLVAFAPCGVAGAKAECIQENIPWLERRADGIKGPTGLFPHAIGGQIAADQDGAAFREDAAAGPHFVMTSDIAKGSRTLVEVSTIIGAKEKDIALPTGIAIALTSEDGSASVRFDMAESKIDAHVETGARALDGSIHRLPSNLAGTARFALTARFVVFGENDRFQIRLQSTRAGEVDYRGDGNSGWRIDTASIRMLDTGASASRLSSKPGPTN